MNEQGCAVERNVAKYEKECNRLAEQVNKAVNLVSAVKDTLTGNRKNPKSVEPSTEPPFQYRGDSVIGCIERMATRLEESNDTLESLLKNLMEYTGDEIGIIG